MGKKKRNIVAEEKYDDANPFILPPTKLNMQLQKQEKSVKRIKSLPRPLSKAEKKRLQKQRMKKNDKFKQEQLLDDLERVRAPVEIMSKLISISKAQTLGRKQKRKQEKELNRNCFESVFVSNPTGDLRTGTLKNKNVLNPNETKKRRILNTHSSDLGFTSSSSDELDNDDPVAIETETKTDIIEPQQQHLQQELSIIEQTTEVSENTVEGAKSKIPTTIMPTKERSSNSGVALKCGSKKCFVPVHRRAEIQEARLKLPILSEEQVIMEAISENDFVVIAGETGSGKTTQLPQFLYEAGYCQDNRLIGITEPRRVAAISMSHRVAEEMNFSTNVVSYLIRFEGNAGPDTKIKFMTDGVLLKEAQHDFLLKKYSAIIIDEAHERSVYTDVLIGLLSRLSLLRREKGNPLKVIIMSATLRLNEFVDNRCLFRNPPPVIMVNVRQFPVYEHFNVKTSADYMSAAYKKICKIHRTLPEGGILVFVTGEMEVNTLVKKLQKTFPFAVLSGRNSVIQSINDETKTSKGNDDVNVDFTRNRKKKGKKDVDDDEDEKEEEEEIEENMKEEKNNGESLPMTTIPRYCSKKKWRLGRVAFPRVDLENFPCQPDDDFNEYELEDEELETCNDGINDEKPSSVVQGGGSPMWVLPLYSLLHPREQEKVFQTPPEGCRLCVVATNVAETSLTIPNIKYVVDTGRAKQKLYDKVTGVTKYAVNWISKSSALQRAGRAGRVKEGHCYRLYSSAKFNDDFPEYDEPEILRKPIDDLVLQMKSMGIHRVVNFPFPTPVDKDALKMAENRLIVLGAVREPLSDREKFGTSLTDLGELMANYSVSPRFAKMLCMSNQFGLLPYAVAIVAALSVQQFLRKPNDQACAIWKSWASHGHRKLLGDVMVLLTALGAAEYANLNGNLEQFCENNGLNYKAVLEARKLRIHLTNEINATIVDFDLMVDPKMKPPTDAQARQLRQILLASMSDQLARKLTPEELKRAALPTSKAVYQISTSNENIYLNSTSVLRRLKPEWIVYQELYQASNDKLYARGITAVEAEWLPVFSPFLCNISEPLKQPAPYYSPETGKIMCYVSSTHYHSGWELPITEIEHPDNEQRIRLFAFYFLQGDVCTSLKTFAQNLLLPASSVLRLFSGFYSDRTRNFLNALQANDIDSKAKLRHEWEQNKSYLLPEYLEWLPPSNHPQIKTLWPPVR